MTGEREKITPAISLEAAQKLKQDMQAIKRRKRRRATWSYIKIIRAQVEIF
jgi:hypothetical protein